MYAELCKDVPMTLEAFINSMTKTYHDFGQTSFMSKVTFTTWLHAWMTSFKESEFQFCDTNSFPNNPNTVVAEPATTVINASEINEVGEGMVCMTIDETSLNLTAEQPFEAQVAASQLQDANYGDILTYEIMEKTVEKTESSDLDCKRILYSPVVDTAKRKK